MMKDVCYECGSKLIPVGFATEPFKTCDKLFWIDELYDCVCQSCLIKSYVRLGDRQAIAESIIVDTKTLEELMEMMDQNGTIGLSPEDRRIIKGALRLLTVALDL